MKTMAEIILHHSSGEWASETREVFCRECGWAFSTWPESSQEIAEKRRAEHLENALTAAGFGLAADAKADAKADALEEAAQAWWLRDDVQDRFGAWNWLINRAAAVRDEG